MNEIASYRVSIQYKTVSFVNLISGLLSDACIHWATCEWNLRIYEPNVSAIIFYYFYIYFFFLLLFLISLNLCITGSHIVSMSMKSP